LSFSAADAEKAIIVKGMAEIQNVTCLLFKPKTNEVGYISYKNNAAGCWATVSYQGAKQAVNMAKDCFSDVIFISSMMIIISDAKITDFHSDPRSYARPRIPTRADQVFFTLPHSAKYRFSS